MTRQAQIIPKTVGPKQYSYEEIVRRLYDMEHVSLLPSAGESSKEFTSYDRNSLYNDETGQYEYWYANADGEGILYEQEDGGKVIAEMKGPGYITRIWSAETEGKGAGKIKIYIDGAVTPVIDTGFYNLFQGNKKLFPYESLSYVAARGLNCYVPITYNQSCKVVVYDDWGLYYHINYTTLPENATVESFAYPLSEKNEKALAKAAEVLSRDLSLLAKTENQYIVESNVKVESKGSAELYSSNSEGTITGFSVTVEGLTGGFHDWEILKQLTIAMYWDHETNPSVWASIQDLFGTTGGVNAYQSFPMGVTADGTFYSRWHMPYSEGARIVVQNEGDEEQTIAFKIIGSEEAATDSMRFHAKWQRVESPDQENERWPDSSILSVEGTGRFLGIMLHSYKTSGEVDPESKDGSFWWGEGDEKFFIDGEKFPSWFGTGTEDYFGYAWCDPTLFSKPYHAQTFNKGGVHDEGSKVVTRYQILDNIPFFHKFDGYIEKYYGEQYVKYAKTAYFYLEKGKDDKISSSDLETRTNYYTYIPPIGTFYEGEHLYICALSQGTVETQGMKAFGDLWSNDGQLWWKPNQKEATLDLYMNLPETGLYTVKAQLTMAEDYGIVQFSYGDTKIGDEIDCYASTVKTTGEITLGVVKLGAGLQTIRVTVTGKNAASSAFLFGLDYLKFEQRVSDVSHL